MATVAVLLAFTIGAVLGGQILSRRRGLDLRSSGSGNLGATNAARAGGTKFGLAVLAIDMGKGLLACWFLPMLAPNVDWLPWACGAAVVLGHVYSPLAGWHGGKGAAAAVGSYAALLPWGLALALPAFMASLVLTGYVSLSILLGASLIWFYVVCLGPYGFFSPANALAAVMFLFLCWTHRDNLRRLKAGNENRFERVMLFKS